ncbi:MAG: o-succinylbenzoate synthase [Balneolaceae bacterium]
MIRLLTYRCPLHTSFRAAGQEWTHRSGLLIEWVDGEDGWVSEAAPLPGRSPDRLEEVIDACRMHRHHLADWIRDRESIREELPPSLLFALSALRLQLRESRTADRPTDNPEDRSRDCLLQMNGVVGLGSPDTLDPAIRTALRDGYTTIKVKLNSEPASRIETLRNLSGEYPHLRLRIDANQSWTWNDARHWLDELSSLPVDYCEEPLRDPTLDNLEKLQQVSTVRIALDESLSTIRNLRNAVRCQSITTYVLKATILGDLEQISRTIGEIPRPIQTIWTSSLESAVARTTLRRAACEWGTPGCAHGLDTGSLFQHDLIDPRLLPKKEQGPVRPDILNRYWALPSRLLDRAGLREIV